MAITPPVTFSQCPVSYAILRNDPPTLSGDRDSGWTATVDFLVAIGDMTNFCLFCAGQPYTISSGGVSITRIIPVVHPNYTSLMCKAISAVPVGGWTGTGASTFQQWSYAKVKVTFGYVPYATDGSQPFMTLNRRGTSEQYTLAGKQLTFSDGTPIQADASVTVPTITYVIKIFQCAAIDDSQVQTLLGCVNSDSVSAISDNPIAAGYLRFDSFDVDSTVTAGQTTYSKTLYLSYRAVKWNQFLKPDGTWDYPQRPDGSYVYNTAALSPLFD